MGTSKGEDDEFEAEVTGAKPGVWLASVTAAEPQELEGDDNMMGYEPQLIRFVWIRDGTVDYNALPSRASVQAPAASEPDADWEVVASFSVDSGTICLFSKHALESLLATGTDREAMLEIFVDDDGDGTNVFVPSGVVCEYSEGSAPGRSYLTRAMCSERKRWRLRDQGPAGRRGTHRRADASSMKSDVQSTVVI